MLLERITEICKEQNTTLAEVERKAGITPKTLNKWDRVMPAADKLARVAAVLGTTSEALLN